MERGRGDGGGWREVEGVEVGGERERGGERGRGDGGGWREVEGVEVGGERRWKWVERGRGDGGGWREEVGGWRRIFKMFLCYQVLFMPIMV